MPHQQEFAFLKFNTELCNSGGIQFLLPKSFSSQKQPIQVAERKRTSNRDSLLCFNAKQTLLRRQLKPNDELKLSISENQQQTTFPIHHMRNLVLNQILLIKRTKSRKHTSLTDFQLFLATNDVFLVFAVSPSILRNSIHL